jgi:hypothetical protein
MKRTGLALALLVLAGGLVADPLFCCTLPAEDPGARFAAPPMGCCPEGGAPGCAPKFEKAAANVPPTAAASTTSVPAAAPTLAVPLQVSRSGSTVSLAYATVERPPRLHLLNSQFRI